MNSVPKPNTRDNIVFARDSIWMPLVIREGDALFLELAAGANANHDPRVFTFPITQAHLEVIKSDFIRHSLLWATLLFLADDAGTQGPLDEATAIALCDIMLFGSEHDINAAYKQVHGYSGHLISHHADIALLEKGEVFAAAQSLTLEADWQLAKEYHAKRRRAQQGIFLSDLEEAVLRYTNQYLQGGGSPSRNPDAVKPEFLAQVLDIVTAAEEASAGMELSAWGDDAQRQAQKEQWNALDTAVRTALRVTHPTLIEEAVRTVSFLMCSEAVNRAKAALKERPTTS